MLFVVVLTTGCSTSTHRPDMPLHPERAEVGLGAEFHPATSPSRSRYSARTLIYARARALDKRGRWGLVGLGAFLIVVYIANIAGPPPPSVGAIEATAFIGFVVLIVWSWWADRHREAILRTR